MIVERIEQAEEPSRAERSLCGTGTGELVAATVRLMSEEIVGAPPGSETRRMISRPKTALSTPIKYPSVDDELKLSTPWGVCGPLPTPDGMTLGAP